jgi:hypothetical protein
MSERIEGSVQASVGRACQFTGLALGAVVNALHGTPILALKVGGLLALIVTFALLLLGARAERTCFSKTRIWRELEGHERPSAEQAQEVIGAARRRAFRIYASWFAVAAAACLAIALAGEVNLILYPPQ